MNDTSNAIRTAFDNQLSYLNSGRADNEGSRAIAAGRAAGLAWDLGKENIAQALWSKEIPNVVGMPSFAEFRAGYEKNKAAFEAFDYGEDFTASGTPFSNAAGSYAYALDNAARGKEALAGGETKWVGVWGAKALVAAGFVDKAEKLNAAIISEQKMSVAPAKGLK